MKADWKDFPWQFDGEWHEYEVDLRGNLHLKFVSAARYAAGRRGLEVRTRTKCFASDGIAKIRVRSQPTLWVRLGGQGQAPDPGGQ